jgi:mono/diheme cytochrome c family protein
MSSSISNAGSMLSAGAAAVAIAVLALLLVAGPQSGNAQDTNRASASAAASGGDQVSRGKYIVENVAMCQTCHTPRTPDGQYIRSRWLQGGPVPYFPAEPTANWPQLVPRIGGRLPASKEQMITLLTTAKWIDGTELRDPMPKFHMNRNDAEAVVDYLQSVSPR